MVFEEALTKMETGATGKMMSARQAEILHNSFKRASQSSKMFDLNYDEFVGLTRPLSHDFIKKQPRQQIKMTDNEEASLDFDALFKQDLKTIFLFAKEEKFLSGDLERLIGDQIAIRFASISLLRDQGMTIIKEGKSGDTRPRRAKLERIIQEVKKYGLSEVDHFYEVYPGYKKKIDATINLDTLTFLELKIFKDLKKDSENRLLLAKLKTDIDTARTRLTTDANPGRQKPERPKTKEEEIKLYQQLLQEALEYIEYSYGKSNPLVTTLFSTLAVARNLGANAPLVRQLFADCMERVYLFWQLRTGRKIEDPKKYGLTPRSVEKYEKFVFDKKIQSAAGEWWFSANDRDLQFYFQHSGEALVQAIQSFLKIPPEYRYGEDSRPIKIMLIVNDNTTAKLSIPPNATREDIIASIQSATFSMQKLSMKEKYQLKTEAYKSSKRSGIYQNFYRHEEPLTIAGHEIPIISDLVTSSSEGDFIFRLTTKAKQKTVEKNSPFNLFTVDSHKALIDIDLSDGSQTEAEISIKYSHRDYDADNQRPYFERFLQHFKNGQKDQNDKSIFELKEIDDAPEIDRSDSIDSQSFPIFEAVAATEEQNFQKIVVEKNRYELSPNTARAVITALANDVTDLFNLHKAEQLVSSRKTHDNIQPATITTNPIIKIYQRFRETESSHQLFRFQGDELFQVLQWIEKTNQAITRAKDGYSYQAVIAAPPGRLEGATVKAVKIVYKPPTLLTESKMMVSDLVDLTPKDEAKPIRFVTAQTNSNGTPVNLTNPKKVAPNGGAIGYIYSRSHSGESQAVTTCRKSPRQAQASFVKFFSEAEGQLFANDNGFAGKQPMALKALNNIISAWERLTVGEVSYKDYQDTFEENYALLEKDSVCGRKNLTMANIHSARDLQARLNMILRQDVVNTINQNKINDEKIMFEAFMKRVSYSLEDYRHQNA